MYMAVPSSASSIFDTKSLSCLQGGKYSARGTAEKHRTITIGNISLISDLVLSYLYLYLYLLLAFTFHIYLEARGYRGLTARYIPAHCIIFACSGCLYRLLIMGPSTIRLVVD